MGWLLAAGGRVAEAGVVSHTFCHLLGSAGVRGQHKNLTLVLPGEERTGD